MISGLLKRAAIYLIGFSAVVAAMAIYLYSQHALGAMVEHFLHHAAAYSESRAIGLPTPKQLWPLAAGLIVSVIVAVLVPRRAPRLLAVFITFATLLSAALVLWSCLAFNFKQAATPVVPVLAPPLIAS